MNYLLFLAFTIQAMADEGKIEILPEAYVKGPSIRLVEIAKIDHLSKTQRSKINGLTLGDAPSFGETRSFSNIALAEMLRSKLGDSSLKFEIPAVVTIKSMASRVDSSSVRKRIHDGVKQTCSGCEVEVKDIVLPEIQALTPSSSWDLTPDWVRVRGSFQVPLEVINGSGKKNIHWVTGKVSLTRNVVVVKRSLMFGEKIQEQDLEMQKRDITYRPDAVTDPKEVIGAQTKVPVSANTFLNRTQIQKPPALVRGQDVTVRAGENGWNVSIKGVAEQSGFIGDSVRVINPLTKKVVLGTIVGDGLVEVR